MPKPQYVPPTEEEIERSLALFRTWSTHVKECRGCLVGPTCITGKLMWQRWFSYRFTKRGWRN